VLLWLHAGSNTNNPNIVHSISTPAILRRRRLPDPPTMINPGITNPIANRNFGRNTAGTITGRAAVVMARFAEPVLAVCNETVVGEKLHPEPVGVPVQENVMVDAYTG
jgi:hypothetical protein